MRKMNLLLLVVSLGLIVWAVPATSVMALTHNVVLTAQQDEPSESAAEETESQAFTGQIANHDGKYTLHGDDGKTYQLDDQDNAKKLDGKNVTVTGTLDEENMTIHVSGIEEVEA